MFCFKVDFSGLLSLETAKPCIYTRRAIGNTKRSVSVVSQGLSNAGLFCDNIIHRFVLFISFMYYDIKDERLMMI